MLLKYIYKHIMPYAKLNAIAIAIKTRHSEYYITKQRSYCAYQPAIKGPAKNAHMYTGICIGDNILPIVGICPVNNGSSRHSARHTAAMVSFCVFTGDIFPPH